MSHKGTFGLLQSFKSEEEYSASKNLSYSVIKDIHNNPDILTKERDKSSKEWLVFGSLVDGLLTLSTEEFNKLFFVYDQRITEQFSNIADYMLKNGYFTSPSIEDEIAKLSDDQINEVYVQSDSKVNWVPSTKRRRLIEDLGPHLKVIIPNRDKTIVTNSMYLEAQRIATMLKTHRWTRDLFLSAEDQKKRAVEIYYQYKIRYVYNELLCKSKLDVIVIDHDLQTISPYDIKTGTDTIEDWIRHALYRYKYGYQGVLYKEGLAEFVSNFPNFKDYYIDDFRFVYVNRFRPTYPVVLRMDQKCHEEIKRYGINTELYHLESLDDLFEEAQYYLSKINVNESNIEPYALTKNYGEVVITSILKYPF